MTRHQTFRINAPDVAHELVEGEVVIVNLASGAYYSSEGTGAILWEMVEKGVPRDEMVRQLQARYAGDEKIEREVDLLLELLLQEKLIVPETRTPGAYTMPALDGSGVFASPLFHKYTDMEDLLVLDPIHEVEQEAGWPHTADNS